MERVVADLRIAVRALSRQRAFTLVAVLTLASISVYGQAMDPVVGTWELNVSKSKMTPGPLPKSQTRVYRIMGTQETSIQKGVDAEGKPTLVEFTATYDGKEYPYKGSPLWDTIALTRVDAHTVSFTQKKDGKIALTGTRVVSKDGTTMTITGKGNDVKGQPTTLLLVLEKR